MSDRSVLGRCVLLAATLALLRPAGAAAGSISISTEVVATARDRTLAVTLNVTNSGDEAAMSVAAQAEFGGASARAEPRPSLRPGERMEATLELPRTQASPGQWPLVTRVDYADAKGYPFQALQVAVVSVMASPSLVAIVDVDAQPVAGSSALLSRATVHVLKSLSDAPRQVRVRLVSPRELEMDPAATTLALAPWGEAAVDAKVVNRAARAGSRYPVFVTAEYDDEGVHHTAVGQAGASIVDGGGLRAHGLLLLAAVLVVVWLALLAWRRFRARPAARV